MKTRGLLFVLFFLLLLSGCLSLNGQKHTIAQMAVATVFYEHPYTFSIVQTNGSSTVAEGKTSYTGTFDLIVQDQKGAETGRRSLNRYFGNQKLTISCPLNFKVQDCNDDNLLDFPLGFSANDGSGEFKYVIFSVGIDGRIFTLPVKGYKENGFIYTVAGENCLPMLTRIVPIDKENNPCLGVGVNGEGGNPAPAEYVWDGKEFMFTQENPFIITQAELADHGRTYSIQVIQTDYKKPLTPDDHGFSIDESMYLGSFDLLVRDSSGKETGRVSLNQYFDTDHLGFGGTFPLAFGDYNNDGNPDFAIGRSCKTDPDFQYILFSVDSKGILSALPVDDGYKDEGFVYNAESGSSTGFPLLKDGETGFTVSLCGLDDTGYVAGKYVWNGSKFIFSKL